MDGKNNITKYTVIALIIGNSSGVRSSVPGTGTETKYMFLINHNITKVVLGGNRGGVIMR